MPGTPYPTFTAGQKVTAAMMQATVPLVATKAIDQSVTSSTTLVNDADFQFSVLANASYVIDSYLQWVGSNTGNIKFAFTFPTPGTLHWAALGPNDTDAGFASGGTRGGSEWWIKNAQTSSPTGSIQYAASTAGLNGRISGLLVGQTAGTVVLQWAQLTSNATATTLKSGSWMSLRRIG